jgi:hypothetical protein
MAKSRKKQADSDGGASMEEVRSELEHIRRLLIVLLLKLGSDSKEIGIALGIDSSTVRKMFPVSKIARITTAAPTKP